MSPTALILDASMLAQIEADTLSGLLAWKRAEELMELAGLRAMRWIASRTSSRAASASASASPGR